MKYFNRPKNIKFWLAQLQSENILRFTVSIPILLIAAYLWLLLPDRYESSSTVLIKESGVAQIGDGLMEALILGGQGASQDEQLLQAYIASIDFFLFLEQELNLSKHYSSHSRDFIFGVNNESPVEELMDFYKKMVSIERDVNTGLLVLKVHAYTPEFTKTLADLILVKSEGFINEVGHDMAIREMAFAQLEIDRSQSLVKQAQSNLLEYQNVNMLMSPDSEGASLISIVYELEADLSKAKAELIQSGSYLNDEAPQVTSLRSKIESLKREIIAQKQRITGIIGEQSNDNLIELGSKYQNLIMDLDLAKALYSSALNAYEMARIQAGKQLKYLVVASKPQLPEKSVFPKRLYWLLSWLVIFVVVFAISRLIVFSIREHID